MGRAPCCDKTTVKKGPWSPEEDTVLKSHIEQHGTGGNWIALRQKIGLKRCGKSCRLRWLNYLRPNIKHGGFTEEEDNLICDLYMSIGSRWSIIASQLPGRTDNDIKNYWNTKLKKKFQDKQRTESKCSLDFKQHTNMSETSEGNYNNNFMFSEFNQTLISFPDQSANFTMQEYYGTPFSQEPNMDAMNVLAATSSSSSQNYNTDIQETIFGMENLEEMIYGNMGQVGYYGTEMMNNVMSSDLVGYPYDDGIFHDGVEGISEDWSYTGVNLANIGQ